MKTSPRGIKLITEFEGFEPQAYEDVAVPGLWTIGYGFIEGVQEGDRITKEQATERLKRELVKYEQAVVNSAGLNLNQNEFDALVCFAFNIGTEGMKKSSVIKAHRRGDKQAAARAFALWNKAGGKVWAGLTRRRAAEAALYLEPMPDDVSDPINGPRQEMPQRVDAESSMGASPINRAATLIGGTSLVGGVAQVADTVSTASYAVSTAKGGFEALGPWLVPILLLAVAGLAGYIIWQRCVQRREGWS